ncbi:MAG TPA: hypothetical protein VGS07_19245 [Thermoanaerobaculia bacterium]|jgi:hypothetical protein|nr:hypothetical protein [Thermoanaerobaculia bacterium]
MHIYPREVIAIILLIAGLIYFRRKNAPPTTRDPVTGRKMAVKVDQTPEEAYMDLRRQAIETDSKRLALPGERKPEEVFGVVMEMGISSSVVTLACFGDGDARVYYKTGGGMIGGISHENVRAAAKDLVARAQKAQGRMIKTATYPLPADDRVRFYVLTGRGALTTETSRQALGERQGELSALFSSGQEVVAQMRLVEEQRTKNTFAPPPMPPQEEPEPMVQEKKPKIPFSPPPMPPPDDPEGTPPVGA